MTTDAQATYYDLEINGTTIETRDIVRAVLERAGLGADASHQLGKVLERCIRLGAKPGTDVGREVEKIHIEAGMLRDAMGGATVAVEPISDDDAEDAARVDLERERNSLSAERRSWHDRNRALSAERQLGEARARIAELERELAGVVDPEQLQRWRTALSASPTETLTNAICRVTSELAALRDRYRPRRQSEEPAPAGVRVMVWSNDISPRWVWRDGQHVNASETWTHQTPAPEAEREGE